MARSPTLRRAKDLVCILGLVAAGCEPNDRSNAGNASPLIRDSAEAVIVESSAPRWRAETAWEVGTTPALTIGLVEGASAYQFTFIRDAILVDSTVVVSDGRTGQVRYYDLEGRHLTSVGRIGEGPGEFSTTASMKLCALPDGSVAVADGRRNRLQIVSPARELVTTVSLPTLFGRQLWPQVCLADGTWIVQGETHVTTTDDVTRRDVSIHVADMTGEVSGEVVRLKGNVTFWNETLQDEALMPFDARDHVIASGLELVVVRASEGQVEWWTRQGQAGRIGRRIGVSRPTTASHLEEAARASLEGAATAEERRIASSFYDTDLPLAELVPVYRGVLADPEGNVWAERYGIPEETAGQWDVFDADGVWLGAIQMPPEVGVTEIGSDYVVAIHRDDLQVETVRIYRITK